MYYTEFTSVKHWCPKEIIFLRKYTELCKRQVLHQFYVSLKLMYVQTLYRDYHWTSRARHKTSASGDQKSLVVVSSRDPSQHLCPKNRSRSVSIVRRPPHRPLHFARSDCIRQRIVWWKPRSIIHLGAKLLTSAGSRDRFASEYSRSFPEVCWFGRVLDIVILLTRGEQVMVASFRRPFAF